MSQPGTVADEIQRRREAALAGHRGDGAAARLFLADPAGRVRATALGALERAQALHSEDVRSSLADADPTVRRRAAELAVRYGDIDLVPSMADADPSVVEAVCWALGERGPDAGDEAIS